MIPLVSRDRLETPGGLWVTKCGGAFVEGNPATTGFFVEGKVEVKEFGGYFKAFFKSIKITIRSIQDKVKIKNDSDDDSDDSDEDKEAQPQTTTIPEATEKIPKLHVFLTTKKPKKRMVDAHKTGTKIKIGQLPEGEFGKIDEENDYEAALVDIADMSHFQGLVVIKLPQDEPKTEEPIVYGFVKLQSSRSARIRSVDALHLNELADMHAKLEMREEMAGQVNVLGPQAKKFLKPLSVYRALAGRAWSILGKGPEDFLDFDELMKVLDHLDLFFLSYQARRIFDAVDIKKEGKIGLLDLENFLVAKDLLSPFGKDLMVMDVYDALKGPPIELPSTTAKSSTTANPVPPLSTNNTNQSKLADKKEKESSKKKGEKEEKKGNNTSVAPLVPPPAQKITDLAKKKLLERPKVLGLGYSEYMEAIEVLGIIDDDPDDIQRSFLYGGEIKPKEADTKLLTLPEFRKAWLKVADVEEELKNRGLKPEGGMFAETRNRERASRYISEREEAYVKSLSEVTAFVEQLKAEHRRKKDEARRQKEAEKERLMHEANKFIAERAQEKRLKLKKEQEEKSKKRLEDKVLRNKLLLRQQENAALKRAEIAQQNAENERLRQQEIRALGLDKLDLSVREMRILPNTLYKGKEAQTKLTYVVMADLSYNRLEDIPPDVFFYWMSDTRKLKLSQNRLRSLPPDLGFMSSLEILDLDSNHLESLPDTLGDCANLQRLNVASNKLTSLPESLGRCGALKYLNAHSNQLEMLPMSIGGCFKLEFIDCSRNQIHELPEDMQYLVSLTHLDLTSNRIGHLPHFIGNCQALQYLDLSENVLAAIPTSFSQLRNLEYCNLENNSIISARGCLKQLENLKYLNMKRNALSELGADIGGMQSLTYLDLTLNHLVSIPLEVGLLRNIQEMKLQRNRLESIPPEIGSCTGLQKLDLSYNRITGCLPEQLSLTRTLRELDISFNDIDELPESIVGFHQLIHFKAERCRISSLPQSFIHLDKLECVDIPNNCFTRFPIELRHMKSLKRLNLYNNAIALLPRNINTMQFLEELNLGKNQLKALPVEFVEILESVPVVKLEENPWDYLPEKWGKLHPGKHVTEASLGYSLPDALNFLYSTRLIYDCVETIWAEYGVFYFTNRLSYQDYLQEVRLRLPSTWHEGLIEFAQHLFFKSKETGIFVRWYELTPEQSADATQKKKMAASKHEASVQQARDDEFRRFYKTQQAYKQDIFRRMRQAADHMAEHSRGEEYIETLQAYALQSQLHKTGKKMTRNHQKREEAIKDKEHQEAARMLEILREDKPNRVAERAYIKSLNLEQRDRASLLAAAAPVSTMDSSKSKKQILISLEANEKNSNGNKKKK